MPAEHAGGVVSVSSSTPAIWSLKPIERLRIASAFVGRRVRLRFSGMREAADLRELEGVVVTAFSPMTGAAAYGVVIDLQDGTFPRSLSLATVHSIEAVSVRERVERGELGIGALLTRDAV